MWPSLAYRCDACRAFTAVEARFVHPGLCTRCRRPLDLRGHPHQVSGTEAGEAIGGSPVPVILVFTGRWKEEPPEERRAVESLARSLSGEVTVLVMDLVEDCVATAVWMRQGRPRAVVLAGGDEIGRGAGYLAERAIRSVLAGRVFALHPPGRAQLEA